MLLVGMSAFTPNGAAEDEGELYLATVYTAYLVEDGSEPIELGKHTILPYEELSPIVISPHSWIEFRDPGNIEISERVMDLAKALATGGMDFKWFADYTTQLGVVYLNGGVFGVNPLLDDLYLIVVDVWTTTYTLPYIEPETSTYKGTWSVGSDLLYLNTGYIVPLPYAYVDGRNHRAIDDPVATVEGEITGVLYAQINGEPDLPRIISSHTLPYAVANSDAALALFSAMR